MTMSETQTKKRFPALIRWKYLIPLSITIVFGYLALRGIDGRLFLDSISEMQPGFLLLSLPFYIGSHFIRAVRWRALLGRMVHASPFRLFPYVVIGLMLNDIIPARIGELYRALLLSRRDGLPYTTSLTVIAVERVFDGLCMLAILIMALSLLDFDAVWVHGMLVIASTVFGMMAVAVFLLAAFPGASRRAIRAVAGLVPGRTGERVYSALDGFHTGIESLRSPKALVQTILATMCQWLIEALFYLMVFYAFGFEAGYSWALLTIAVVSFGTILPAAPGYAGVFEYAFIMALAAVGVGHNEALASAVTVHIIQLAVVFAMGAFFMFRLGFKLPTRNGKDSGSIAAEK